MLSQTKGKSEKSIQRAFGSNSLQTLSRQDTVPFQDKHLSHSNHITQAPEPSASRPANTEVVEVGGLPALMDLEDDGMLIDDPFSSLLYVPQLPVPPTSPTCKLQHAMNSALHTPITTTSTSRLPSVLAVFLMPARKTILYTDY